MTTEEEAGQPVEKETFVESKDVKVAEGKATGEVTFDGLDIGAKYRIYEMNGDNKIAAGGELGEYTVTYDSNQTLEITRAAKDGETTVTNNEKSLTLNILKVDKENTQKKLPNAEFTLRRIDGSIIGNSVNYVEGANAVTRTATTNSDGEAEFTGITPGYYEVEETKLPDGYIKTGKGKSYIRVDDTVELIEMDLTVSSLVWKVVSTSDAVIEFTAEAGSATTTVGNTPGSALPNAGGPGTTLIYLLGLMLLGLAGSGVFMKRRRDAA